MPARSGRGLCLTLVGTEASSTQTRERDICSSSRCSGGTVRVGGDEDAPAPTEGRVVQRLGDRMPSPSGSEARPHAGAVVRGFLSLQPRLSI